MNAKANTPFIFYLTLEEELSRSFYIFDRAMKDLGFILVPVRIDQLQSLVASTDQTQIVVLTCVTDTRELKLYHEKVRSLLRFVLKSKRLTFMHLSSFSKINDSKSYSMSKNYFFLKFPLDARLLAAKIARYHDLKSATNLKWPGGKKAGLGAIS